MVQHNLKMESVLKAALKTSTLTRTGQSGGGCINQGEAYITDTGTVFVKSNKKSKVGMDTNIYGKFVVLLSLLFTTYM